MSSQSSQDGELVFDNQSRLEDISKFLFDKGIRTKASNRWMSEGGRLWKRDQITAFLSNPFYCGLFRYAGELFEGKHTPIISKQLFDKVQTVLKERSKPQVRTKEPKPLCGLFRCGECGRMITAEVQKGHTYYRCSKKGVVCSQPYIREEILAVQLTPPKIVRPKNLRLERSSQKSSYRIYPHPTLRFAPRSAAEFF